MLNGRSPIILFNFYSKAATDFLSGALGLETPVPIGLPVPIYLADTLANNPINPASGILFDGESKAIDVQTTIDVQPENDPVTGAKKEPIVSQTLIDSQVSIKMIASADSLVLSIFLAMMDMIAQRLSSAEYGITYLNRSTVIFNGLLHRFSTDIGANDDLLRIDLTLSKGKQKGTKEKESKPSVANDAAVNLTPG